MQKQLEFQQRKSNGGSDPLMRGIPRLVARNIKLEKRIR